MNASSCQRRLRFACAVLLALPLYADLASGADLGQIPDVEVQDQNGRSLHFFSDLVQGKVVAVNFIFTSCSTICPQLGASSATLAQHLAGSGEGPYRVISVSLDPDTDTPARLHDWSLKFGPAPGWTLVTGSRRNIDTLLKAMQAYTPDKTLHSSTFLLGNAATGEWRRVAGTAAPDKIAAALAVLGGARAPRELAAPQAPPALSGPSAAAQRYFPDVALVNQDGEPRRFYTDLIKGRIVVIDTFFTECTAACPVMAEKLAAVQARLRERAGRDVFLVSISIDPVTDTPAKLHAYAERVGAKAGWQFLTGDRASVNQVVEKLGQYTESRDAHSNIILIGNEPTGLWKKAFGLAPVADLERVVDSVVNDGH